MQTISVCGGTLFDIACRYLGDASQWGLIAQLNEIADPWLSGLNVLVIPNVSNGGSLAGE